MKKIAAVFLLFIVFLVSCSMEHSFTLNDDGTVTMDSTVFYPLENSYRFTDYGYGEKQGEVLGGKIYITKGEDTVLLLKKEDSYTYYVKEELKDFDKLLEECNEFFFVPVEHMDKNGRVTDTYLKSVKKLRGEDAQDFSFYVFYGRTPKENGYTKGAYAGEVYGTFPELDSLVSAYSVYKYDDTAYGIVIDGEEYLMEENIAKMIGIIR